MYWDCTVCVILCVQMSNKFHFFEIVEAVWDRGDVISCDPNSNLAVPGKGFIKANY